MDKLSAIYECLGKLRNSGVKMKDVAEASGMPSSVLSSLYSSVLPCYSTLTGSGVAPDEAIDKALKSVNNISRRRLSECVDGLYRCVTDMAENIGSEDRGDIPVLAEIAKAARRHRNEADTYAGVYTAYSAGLGRGEMKAEPYMITSTAGGAAEQLAYYRTREGNTVKGTCLFTPFQTGYIVFNERRGVQLALKTVCLKLPVLVFPHYIKGIYVNHDYNRNPVARRILLVREGDEMPLDEFACLKAGIITPNQLHGDLTAYYDYTCRKEDSIRSMIFSSPGKDINDLAREKDVLDKT